MCLILKKIRQDHFEARTVLCLAITFLAAGCGGSPPVFFAADRMPKHGVIEMANATVAGCTIATDPDRVNSGVAPKVRVRLVNGKAIKTIAINGEAMDPKAEVQSLAAIQAYGQMKIIAVATDTDNSMFTCSANLTVDPPPAIASMSLPSCSATLDDISIKAGQATNFRLSMFNYDAAKFPIKAVSLKRVSTVADIPDQDEVLPMPVSFPVERPVAGLGLGRYTWKATVLFNVGTGTAKSAQATQCFAELLVTDGPPFEIANLIQLPTCTINNLASTITANVNTPAPADAGSQRFTFSANPTLTVVGGNLGAAYTEGAWNLELGAAEAASTYALTRSSGSNILMTQLTSANFGAGQIAGRIKTNITIGGFTQQCVAPDLVVQRNANLSLTLTTNNSSAQLTDGNTNPPCTGTCTYTIPAGSSVNVQDYPYSGSYYYFGSWSGGPCSGSSSSTCSFAMSTAVAMSATQYYTPPPPPPPSPSPSPPPSPSPSPTPQTCPTYPCDVPCGLNTFPIQGACSINQPVEDGNGIWKVTHPCGYFYAADPAEADRNGLGREWVTCNNGSFNTSMGGP